MSDDKKEIKDVKKKKLVYEMPKLVKLNDTEGCGETFICENGTGEAVGCGDGNTAATACGAGQTQVP